MTCFFVIRHRLLFLLVGAAFLSGVIFSSYAQPAPEASDDLRLVGEIPIVMDARLAGDLSRTRFVIDLSRDVPYTVQTLETPHRILIDIPQAVFTIPPKITGNARGLVENFRYGAYSDTVARIVLDLKKPAEIDRHFILPPLNNQPARMVVDIVPANEMTTPEDDGFALKGGLREGEAAFSVQNKGDNDTDVFKVVLDPGHGGVDTGAATSGDIAEKTLVLEIARQLRDELQRIDGVRVFLTREIDEFVFLDKRVDIARSYGADLFVSLHADSIDIDYVRGATVYHLSEKASDKFAEQFAAKENKSDLLAGELAQPATNDAVNDIMIDLTKRETRTFSVYFAHLLAQHLKGEVKMNKNPIRSANLRVLRAFDIPSVLLEVGYLSNLSDEKQILSKDWRNKMTRAIAKAVQAYISQRANGALKP